MSPSADQQPAKQRRLKGLIETQKPVLISGWAIDFEPPGAPVTVSFVLDGVELGAVLADRPRLDLAAAGLGDGSKGFLFHPPDRLSAADLPYVEVGIRTHDGATARLRHLPGRAPLFPGALQNHPSSPPAASEEQRPIFVIGSRRSGTSVVAQALLDQTRYRGHYEGHLLDVARLLERRAAEFYAEKFQEWTAADRWTMLGDTPEADLREALRDTFRRITARLFPANWWLDKTPTPGMILSVPLLLEIWPQARIIFMRRRAFENVASQGRKFTHETFRQHCRWWADSMVAWTEVRGAAAGRAVEMDQQFVARHPAAAARVIGELTELDGAEIERLGAALSTSRPERTQPDPAAILTDHPEAWIAADRAAFDQICRPLLAPFGYGERDSYFVSDDPALRWRRW